MQKISQKGLRITEVCQKSLKTVKTTNISANMHKITRKRGGGKSVI